MLIQNSIEKKLKSLNPEHLEVINESNNHNVPDGSESHFKVIVISNEFAGLKLVGRHRIVNRLLADELANSIHALSIHAKTPDEWFDSGATSVDSPDCLGGTNK
jgi:BolA family transcriptional regulator, general stress-responsive regulator